MEAAQPQKIKDLDTGEEYDLEEFMQRMLRRGSGTGGQGGVLVAGGGDHSDGEEHGASGDEEPHAPAAALEGGAGRKKAATTILKGTKKFKTWAKSTLATVKEKIEEAKEQRAVAASASAAAAQSRAGPSWSGAAPLQAGGSGASAAPASYGSGRPSDSGAALGPLQAALASRTGRPPSATGGAGSLSHAPAAMPPASAVGGGSYSYTPANPPPAYGTTAASGSSKGASPAAAADPLAPGGGGWLAASRSSGDSFAPGGAHAAAALRSSFAAPAAAALVPADAFSAALPHGGAPTPMEQDDEDEPLEGSLPPLTIAHSRSSWQNFAADANGYPAAASNSPHPTPFAAGSVGGGSPVGARQPSASPQSSPGPGAPGPFAASPHSQASASRQGPSPHSLLHHSFPSSRFGDELQPPETPSSVEGGAVASPPGSAAASAAAAAGWADAAQPRIPDPRVALGELCQAANPLDELGSSSLPALASPFVGQSPPASAQWAAPQYASPPPTMSAPAAHASPAVSARTATPPGDSMPARGGGPRPTSSPASTLSASPAPHTSPRPGTSPRPAADPLSGWGGGGAAAPYAPRRFTVDSAVSGLTDDSAEPLAGQPHVDLRVPLLAGEEAEPSSRAVPAGKSMINQTARVAGTRKVALRQLQQVRMVQDLYGHDGVVWAMRFSADSRLLASGGRDGVLRIWGVNWSHAARAAPADLSSAPEAPNPAEPTAAAGSPASAPSPTSAGGANPASAFPPHKPRPPLLSASPLLSLTGHRGDILDLCWSRCRMLLTASADCTARLWVVEGAGEGDWRAECLRAFSHPDFVTSCAFHPSDTKLLATGCADGKVRVWDALAGAVLCTATVQQDVVTRLLWAAPGGGRLLVGTLRAKARHYEYTGSSLDFLAQIEVKNKGSAGNKVTGLVQAQVAGAAGLGVRSLDRASPLFALGDASPGAGSPGPGAGGELLYVITSADSRIRMFNGLLQERKFKGHRLNNTQIGASLSSSCEHLVCGSDDGGVYVWETGLASGGGGGLVAPASAPAATGGSLMRSSTSHSGLTSNGATGAAGMGPASVGVGARPRTSTVKAKAKEATYESFQTPEQATTVALIAPDVCGLGRDTRHLAITSQPLLGALFVVAGFSGRIYVYENLPATAEAVKAAG